MRKLRPTITATANIFLLLATITAILFSIEILFRTQLHRLPLRFHQFLESCDQTLAQSSKRKTVPINYIALFGDSYAKGHGDSLLSANDWTNPLFGSQRTIFRRLRKDIVSFGHGGHGSFHAMVYTPINTLKCLYVRHELMEPDQIVVYFYAGNDLEDNLRFLDSVKESQSESILRSYLDFRTYAYSRTKSDYEESPPYLHSLRFFSKLASSLLDDKFPERNKSSRKNGDINRILVNGVVLKIPDSLQAPALELSRDEIDRALLVFEYSLIYLKQHFSSQDILLVYVPTPLESYELDSTRVSSQRYFERPGIYESNYLKTRSDYLSNRIGAISSQIGVAFLDGRGKIRKASRNQILHGPIDWKHFNRYGHKALGDAVASQLDKLNDSTF